MPLLTRLALGQALRYLCICKYKRIKSAAYILDMDDRDLRRAWTLQKRSRISFDKLMWLLGQLGYEVHFTILVKGSMQDAQNQRLPTSNNQGVSTR